MALKLYDLIDTGSPEAVFAEIAAILSLVDPAHETGPLENVYRDIIRLFAGQYPGYRASNTGYHNLEHTLSVALASARLIHGLHVRGDTPAPRLMDLGLISALFHDTGLIQTEEEQQGTGARYTEGHEQRSIELMAQYLAGHGFTAASIDDCSRMIRCTILTLSPAEIDFRSAEAGTMGRILGSADLIAQMADRTYLEKLPLLFMEFKEAEMHGFETPLELFKHTEQFYHSVVLKRLHKEMGNIAAAARFHFRERWDIDRDLYAESITNNIEYLKRIYAECADDLDCVLARIRRSI